MKDINFEVLSKKAEELRAIFILGQRLTPFLEDIFGFVHDIKPLLDDINLSVEENMHKMQNASRQLSKVTEANETATTEIINIVDDLVSKSGIISSNMEQLDKLNSIKYDTALNALEVIYKAVTEKKDVNKYVPQLSDAIDKMKTMEGIEYKELFDSTRELLNSITNDSNSIMMSLQIQDITSQQIAAVNYLLDTMRDKLGNILMKFKPSNISSLVSKEKADDKTVISVMHRPIAFSPEDGDATYFSQEDIDDLFGKQS